MSWTKRWMMRSSEASATKASPSSTSDGPMDPEPPASPPPARDWQHFTPLQSRTPSTSGTTTRCTTITDHPLYLTALAHLSSLPANHDGTPSLGLTPEALLPHACCKTHT
ncbi:MAG: hypothetical protein WDW38_007542 [Sanguina aurantia]